jgi:DNA modification methylase
VKPWLDTGDVQVFHGDCIEVMRSLPDASVDAVVTDPPYELAFMGKRWDATGIAYDLNVWREALRVLKPGGHLLAFGGTRTWHRLAVAIEDAGFEVRDSIAWMYGSGFPKSLDVSKAIDRKRDDREDVLRVTGEIARLRDIVGLSNRDLDDAFGFAGMAGHWTSTKSQPTVPTVEQWAVLRDMLNPDEWLDAEVWRLNGRKGQPGEAWANAEIVSLDERHNEPSGVVNIGQGERTKVVREIKAPATPAAQQWQGWGTALKPAFEPIVVARKPLIGTVAENVLAHGTGGLNIDGCRIGYASEADKDSAQALADLRAKGRRLGVLGEPGQGQSLAVAKSGDTRDGTETVIQHTAGRWPANVILDESQAAELDKQADELPSRFFYVAKANSNERPRAGDIAHPTVKPLELMTYLVRLVTPPGGTVLEPFAGSGTTLEACVVEGFNAIGIEREADYLPLIEQRLSKPIQQVLA